MGQHDHSDLRHHKKGKGHGAPSDEMHAKSEDASGRIAAHLEHAEKPRKGHK